MINKLTDEEIKKLQDLKNKAINDKEVVKK
jgi:hypothetical protein